MDGVDDLRPVMTQCLSDPSFHPSWLVVVAVVMGLLYCVAVKVGVVPA